MSRRAWWVSGALLLSPVFVPLGASAQDEGQGGEEATFVDPTPTQAVPPPAVQAPGVGGSAADLTIPEPPGTAATPEGYGARAPESRLTVLGFQEPRLRLFLSDRPSGPLHEFCTAPCVSALEPGTYRFGVAPHDGGPRTADDQPMRIGRDSVAILHYDNRSGLRSAGWAFFTAAAMALAASATPLLFGGGNIFPLLLIGTPIAAAFMIPFFSLAFLMDSARIEIATLPR